MSAPASAYASSEKLDAVARAGLDHYVVAQLDQLPDRLRRGGDARLTSWDSLGIPMIIDFDPI